ncbi:CaiB/BaiF CoA transferase family protein [Marinobacter sp. GN3S48]|uniref:CaiB/BaiF CoA transferase family protein n=1 Tax=Marinobacter sp. GN3S48 TaxID=3382302 RepID=UPI00387B6C39
MLSLLIKVGAVDVGVLTGVCVVEMAGIGPGPFCGMLLADMGADVIRVDRIDQVDRGINFPSKFDLLNRNKRSIAIDLKSRQGLETVHELVKKADVLIEGFRPGAMEKLGLGPDVCLSLNPKLAYGRMTGWGQDGAMSKAAGHDLNFIALTGVLDSIGKRDDSPTIPLNLIGDFGGGALYLALGLLAAVIEARSSGEGQVVDAAIVDGVSSLMTMQYALKQMGQWSGSRGTNLIDGGAPFYNVYETSDGLYVSIAPVEGRFYGEMLNRLGLGDEELPKQNDPKGWQKLNSRFAEVFKSRTRDEWCQLLLGTDACFAPVLTTDEYISHPHSVEREAFVEIDGVTNPSPAPRFSRTPSKVIRVPPKTGRDTTEVLKDWGITDERVAELRAQGVINK